MIIPIRCFTCGKVLADKWRRYQELSISVGDLDEEDVEDVVEVAGGGGAKKKTSKNKNMNKVMEQDNTTTTTNHSNYFDKGHKGAILDGLGIVKICCRRHMLTHVDLVDIL